MATALSRTRRVAALALLAAAPGLLLGCGFTARVRANRSLVIGLTEYRVSPQRVQASAGELSLFVRNLGRLTHNLSVRADGQPVAATKPIAPGHSAWLYLYLAPGHYVIASTLFSDQALGQYGTLVVN